MRFWVTLYMLVIKPLAHSCPDGGSVHLVRDEIPNSLHPANDGRRICGEIVGQINNYYIG